MKGMRSIPRILKINRIEKYNVSCLFSNGESRIIDFQSFFQSKKNPISKADPEYILINDIQEFNKIELIDKTIGWNNTGLVLKDFDGNEKFYPYQLDPLVLYEFSTKDEAENLQIGKRIKEERKKAGLSQAELATKSGTSKHYISRLENDKSDIELLTLKKIIEAGLGKEMKINFE